MVRGRRAVPESDVYSASLPSRAPFREGDTARASAELQCLPMRCSCAFCVPKVFILLVGVVEELGVGMREVHDVRAASICVISRVSSGDSSR